MTTRRTTIRDVSRSNRSRVLRELYFRGPSGRTRLSRDTGLSPATIANIVGELADPTAETVINRMQQLGG